MSRMTRREIAAAFAQGDSAHGAGALRSEGRLAYSYAEPIAIWTGEPGASECLVSTLRYSMTTSHHLGAIRSALASAGKRIRYVEHAELQAFVSAYQLGAREGITALDRNPGCDRCGTYDRAPNSVLCSHCSTDA